MSEQGDDGVIFEDMSERDKLQYENERKFYPEREINKRVLGKKILELCGNEGTEDDSNNAGLRRLLQHAITVIEKETEDVLKNAEFKFYDDKCNIYVIKSGNATHKFIFMFDENFEPIYCVQRSIFGKIKASLPNIRQFIPNIPMFRNEDYIFF